MMIPLIVRLIKVVFLHIMSCFIKPYTHNWKKQKLNQICLIMQQNVLFAAGIHTWNFPKKTDWGNVK